MARLQAELHVPASFAVGGSLFSRGHLSLGVQEVITLRLLWLSFLSTVSPLLQMQMMHLGMECSKLEGFWVLSHQKCDFFFFAIFFCTPELWFFYTPGLWFFSLIRTVNFFTKCCAFFIIYAIHINFFIIYVVCSCSVAQSCLTFLWPHGLYPARFLCPWDFPGKNTGVSCHFLLQGIFLTQELNPCLLHWQADSLPVSHQGSPYVWCTCIYTYIVIPSRSSEMVMVPPQFSPVFAGPVDYIME